MIQALVLLFVGADVLVLAVWNSRKRLGLGGKASAPAPEGAAT
jgi:hypothetical protein